MCYMCVVSVKKVRNRDLLESEVFMKEVFKAINKLNLFIRINLYVILVFGTIAYVSFLISLLSYLII